MSISLAQLRKQYLSRNSERYLRKLERKIFDGENISKKALIEAIRRFVCAKLKCTSLGTEEIVAFSDLTLNLSAIAEKVFEYGESAADKISSLSFSIETAEPFQK